MSQTKAQLISDLVQALNFTGTSSAPANGMYLSAANTIKLATNSNGRLTIDSSGNATFTGTCTATTFSGSGANLTNLPDKDQIKEGNSYAEILDTGNNGIFRFLPEGTEVFRIDKDGKVGIGTNNAGTNLHIQNTSANPQVRISSANNGICELQFGDQADTVRGNIIYRNGSAGDALCFNGYNNTERMRIDSTGKVGIGTTSPDRKLEVLNDGAYAAKFGGASGGSDYSIEIGQTGNSGSPGFNAIAGSMVFQIAGSEVARFNDSTGNFGINNASPDCKLEVTLNNDYAAKFGGLGGGDFAIEIGQTGTNGSPGFNATGSGASMVFDIGDSEKMRIDPSGRLGIGTSSPSAFSPSVHIKGTDPCLLLEDSATAVDYYGMNITAGAVTTWFDDAAYFRIGTGTGLTGSSYAELLRITKDGHVGIGSTTPHDSSWGTASTTKFLHIKGTNYGVLSIEGSNGANTKWSIGAGDGRLYHYMENDAAHVLDLVRSTKDIEAPAGNFVLRAANKGIDFTGGSSVGTAANILDDYEYGSWTPVLTFANYSISSQSNAGSYIKIGNLVWCEFTLSVNSGNISGTPSSGGWVRIYGVPVNSSSSVGYQYLGNPTACGKLTQYVGTNGSNDFNLISFNMPANVNYLGLGASKNPQPNIGTDYLYGLSEETWAGAVNAGSYNTEMRGSFTYRTDA